jgi:hypothetical protein
LIALLILLCCLAKDEFNMNIIMTSPSVPYLIEYADGTSVHVSNIAQWPEVGRGAQFTVKEPMVKVRGGGAVERAGHLLLPSNYCPPAYCALTQIFSWLSPPLLSLPLTQVILITPKDYYGEMCEIVKDRRGTEIETQFLDDGQVLLSGAVSARSCTCVHAVASPLSLALSLFPAGASAHVDAVARGTSHKRPRPPLPVSSHAHPPPPQLPFAVAGVPCRDPFFPSPFVCIDVCGGGRWCAT